MNAREGGGGGERTADALFYLTNPPGLLLRDKWTAKWTPLREREKEGVGVPHTSSSFQHLCEALGHCLLDKRHLPDIEQWSRAEAPTSSRGGLVLALLA